MIRVLLADDGNLIRSALAALLALEDDLEVVARAATAAEALGMARAHTPDVAVLDLQLPDRDGISLAADLGTVVPGTGRRRRAGRGDRGPGAPVPRHGAQPPVGGRGEAGGAHRHVAVAEARRHGWI